MPDAEGAQYNMQVGETEGVNSPAAIPWCTTAWRWGRGCACYRSNKKGR